MYDITDYDERDLIRDMLKSLSYKQMYHRKKPKQQLAERVKHLNENPFMAEPDESKNDFYDDDLILHCGVCGKKKEFFMPIYDALKKAAPELILPIRLPCECDCHLK